MMLRLRWREHERPDTEQQEAQVLDPRPHLTHAAKSTQLGMKALCTPSGVKGAATELAWITAHAGLYPFALSTEKRREKTRDELDRFTLSDLPPVQRGLVMGDVVAAGTPIVLIHGLVDNRSIFTVLRRQLRRRGFGRVITLNYSPFAQDVRTVAARLGELIERTCADTGYERVHVIGHSLGGLVARYYVQRLGGDTRVHTLCTLGTPHSGTTAAHFWPQKLVKQLRPGSDLLTELEQPAPGCRTRFVAFWSDLDQLVLPKRSASIEHPDLQVRNLLFRGVGHMSLPIDGGIVREISGLLAHLDEDGHTLTPGVTTLAAPVLPAEPVEIPVARRRLGLRRSAGS